jgi:hypothetical protein
MSIENGWPREYGSGEALKVTAATWERLYKDEKAQRIHAQNELKAELDGNRELRGKYGAYGNETMMEFIDRMANYEKAFVNMVESTTSLMKKYGAYENETLAEFLKRLATKDTGQATAWVPVTDDTAFAPPFGTIRKCDVCGCLVAGGPTRCARCD